MAYLIRRYGAVLYARRRTIPCSRRLGLRSCGARWLRQFVRPHRAISFQEVSIPGFANEPRMQAIEAGVRKLGIHTLPIPLGLKRIEDNPLESNVFVAIPAMAILVSSTPNLMRTSTYLADSSLAERNLDDQFTSLSPRHQLDRHSRHWRRGCSFRFQQAL